MPKKELKGYMLGLPWGNAIGSGGHNKDHPAMTMEAATKRAQQIIDSHEQLGRPINPSEIEFIHLSYAQWFIDEQERVLDDSGNVYDPKMIEMPYETIGLADILLLPFFSDVSFGSLLLRLLAKPKKAHN